MKYTQPELPFGRHLHVPINREALEKAMPTAYAPSGLSNVVLGHTSYSTWRGVSGTERELGGSPFAKEGSLGVLDPAQLEDGVRILAEFLTSARFAEDRQLFGIRATVE